MGNQVIDFNLIKNYMPDLMNGAIISIAISIFSCFIGFVLGTMLGILQAVNNPIVKLLVNIYTTVIRGTPMLIQIAFVYFLLPHIGIEIPPFWASVIAIGLNSAAYISQIIYSGIMAVDIGEIEAAKTLGFNKWQIIRYIILPQAFSVVLPALTNELITLVKDSSLASTIGVMELFKEGKTIINQTYDAISVYAAIAVIYLTITTLLTLLANKLQMRLNYAKN